MHKQVDCASYVHDKLQRYNSPCCFSHRADDTTRRHALHKTFLDIEASNLNNKRCIRDLKSPSVHFRFRSHKICGILNKNIVSRLQNVEKKQFLCLADIVPEREKSNH